jgi:hypothetical protein
MVPVSLKNLALFVLTSALVFAGCDSTPPVDPNKPGEAKTLAFTVQPVTTAAGAPLAPALKVEVRDADGKVVTDSSVAVTLALRDNPAGATLSGTTTVAASQGVATFSGLSLDKAAEGYTLVARAEGLEEATSQAFAIQVGPAQRLAFTVAPGEAEAGAAFTPVVRVAVQDAVGNLVKTTTPITLALGANPAGGTLSGTRTVNTVDGVATFAELSLDKAGEGYTLVASRPGLTPVTSAPFRVRPAAARALLFATQPAQAVAGRPLAPAVQVRVVDAYGNTTVGTTASVTVALGANAVGATLGGTVTVAAVDGVATFADLVVEKVGTAYTLTASSQALQGALSQTFDVVPGEAMRFGFRVQPSRVRAGANLAPAVEVLAFDSVGNVATGFGGPVTLALATNPTGDTLGGTVTVNAVAGVARFESVSLTRAGTGYTLTALSPGLTPATSVAFDVEAAQAARLTFAVQPSTTSAGAVLAPAVQVRIEDSFGNLAAASSRITLTLAGGSAGAVLNGTRAVDTVASVATFADLSVGRQGTGYTLSASATGLTAASSRAFDIVHGAPSRLAFLTQPGTLTAGEAFSPAVSVVIQDAQGNTATSATLAVTVGLGTNPAGGTLSGTRTVQAVGGVATFPGLSVAKVGSGYTLEASASAVTSATSQAFAVTPGAPARLVFRTQPSNAIAGEVLTPVVQVTVQDSAGNVLDSTASVTLALGTNPAGGTLAGTRTVNAVAGVATFSNLSLDKAGTGYTLVASSTGLTEATSAAFDIQVAAPSRLAFRVQPSNAPPDVAITPAVVVRIEDAFGNRINSTERVTVALGANPGGALLSGTLSVDAVAGEATFPSLVLDQEGTGYTLTASAPGLASATSTAFDIVVSPATQLAFTVRPSDVVAGRAMAPAVEVTLRDAAGNRTTSTASVTLALGSNPGGATLSGTTTVNAVQGRATFTGLSLDKVGSGYTLVASSAGLPDVTSQAFDVTPGVATRLAFRAQPSTTVAGEVLAPALEVVVLDALDNPVTGSTAAVTLRLGANPGGTTLSGTLTVNAVAGVATFSNLRLDKAAAGYTLIASVTGINAATSEPFEVVPGAAARLVFTSQPTSTTTGATLSPAVQVTVQDALGNTVTSSSASVTVALGAHAGTGTLGGTLTVQAQSGVARFASLFVDKVGSGYTLVASSTGLPSATSTAFDISAGAATRLAFRVQPSTVVAGEALAPAVEVHVLDGLDNLVTSSSATIRVELGSAPSGGSLSGPAEVSAVNGVARFSGLSLPRAGTGYTLVASSAALTSATSEAFEVTPAQARALAFRTQPSNVTAGAPITPAVQVDVLDAFGNRVTGSSASISVAVAHNPSGGTLSGALTVSAESGLATFSNLSLEKAGSGYTLTASSNGLLSITSSAFNVTPDAPARLVFTGQPSDVTAGATIAPSVEVRIVDALGNTVASSNASITVALGTNPSTGVLQGTRTVSAVGGVATFPGLFITQAGTGYTLTASSSGLPEATSEAFQVTPSTPTALSFLTDVPATVQAGEALQPAVRVRVVDAFENLVTSSSASITLSLAVNPGNSVLGGTLTVAATGGVATFPNLTLDKVASGYSLAAASTGLTGASSAFFNVTAAPASTLTFTTQPANVVAGVTFGSAVEVTVRDAFGNVVTSPSIQVSLALGNNPGGATLGGTTTVTTAGGVATFSTLTLEKAGTGYTLVASADALPAATSNAFNVSPAAPRQLAFTAQPSSISAGTAFSPAVEVTLQDAFGNRTTSGASVTLALASNPGGSTLSGFTTVSASQGRATFNGVSLNKVGTGYTLVASVAGLTNVTSQAFDVTPGAALRLAYRVQPSTAMAGEPLTPALEVLVLDAFDNLVTGSMDAVTLKLDANPGNATLLGVPTVNAVAGVATFADVKLDKVGTGYTLLASATGLTGATSAPFEVVPGPAARLSFTTQPTSTGSGITLTPAVQVTVQDAHGNTVTSSSASVTVALEPHASGGTLGGTLTVQAQSGVASFDTLSVDTGGIGYKLVASSTDLTPATSEAFDIFGLPAALAFRVQPSTVVAGESIAPAVEVLVVDALGLHVTSSNATVTLALGSAPGGASLSGTVSVNAVNGVARFDALSLPKAGTGYTLVASSTGLTSATSTSFEVTPAQAHALAFRTQPANVTAGASITPAVVVDVLDAFGNRATGSTASVSVVLNDNPGSGTLSGTRTVNAVAGVATFSGLSINKSGSGYTLAASSPGLTGAISAAFNVTAAAASRLAFTVQPSLVAAGSSITPAVQVEVTDTFGNRVTTSTASITMAFGNIPTPGSILNGTRTVSAVGGVATFSTLSITKTGDGYTLTAAATGLTNATSAAFNVVPGAATSLAFFTNPPNVVTAGAAIAPAVKVGVRDSFGNTVTGSTASITVSLSTNPGGSVLSGTLTVAAVDGVATFPDLSLNKAANSYRLAAASPGLTTNTSALFNVAAASATKLAFTTQPANVAAGATFATSVRVTVQDAFDNTVTTPAVQVGIALGNNPGGSTLSGTASVTTASGVATFSTLTLNKVGTGYTLVSTATGLTSTTSAAFNVTPGAASALVFTTQPPATTPAGTALAPAVQVTVLDAQGNTVTGATTSITVGLGSNPAGGSLAGTLTVSAVGGVATFSNLSLPKVGTGYTLNASATGLTSATSTAFSITPAAASQLAFTTQPSRTFVGQAISPAVQVTVRDAFGNTVTDSNATVTLSLGSNPSGAILGGTFALAAVNGVASFADLTVDRTGTSYTLVATSTGLTSASSGAFNVVVAGTRLVYVDPIATGQLALVRNPASTDTTVVLDLMALEDLVGYSVGMNLPLDVSLVQAPAEVLTPGLALPAGTSPVAAYGKLPTSGPLANVLTVGQSQKASGAGAVLEDSIVPAGSVLYTVRLSLKPGAITGVVFDGAALGAKYRALMRDKLGTDVVSSDGFSIGRLEVQ